MLLKFELIIKWFTGKKIKKDIITACCSWKSGKVKTAYQSSYIHANIGLDLFDARVTAATVLQFVYAAVFVFSSACRLRFFSD